MSQKSSSNWVLTLVLADVTNKKMKNSIFELYIFFLISNIIIRLINLKRMLILSIILKKNNKKIIHVNIFIALFIQRKSLVNTYNELFSDR